MAEPFADPADYALRTGRASLAEVEEGQIMALLGEASVLMRQAAADLDARVAVDTGLADLAKGTAVRIVQRYLANPTQAAQVTTGPFSRAWAAANARGLFVTVDEALPLAPPPADATRPRGLGTIRVGLAVGTARPGPCRWPR